jgi:hypothetical protein
MRRYFVSYFYRDKRSATGYGNTEILRPIPIQSMEDIKGIVKCIAETKNLRQVAVLNWRLFEEHACPAGIPSAKEAT